MHAFSTLLSLVVLLASALPSLAVPTHSLLKRQDETKGDCNLVGQQCCQTLVPQSSSSGSALSGLLGLSTLSDLGANLGFGCSPVASVLSGPSGTCTGTMVCCTGESQMSGLVNVGCTPVQA